MIQQQLHIESLGISRGERVLVQPFNASLKAGALVILTGANGSGKSTLLRTLVGLRSEASGEIRFNGQNINAISAMDKAQLIAFSNSKKIDDEYIRVIDLVRLGRYPYLRVFKAGNEDETLIERSMKSMGITHISHKFLNQISDGELQKASIVRAFVQDTPFLMFDEPSAFLDYPSKKALFETLRHMALEQNKIILCATHDIELAAMYGTEFWHIADQVLNISAQQKAWLP